jgi:potassium-dependent mechanosensitive channel
MARLGHKRITPAFMAGPAKAMMMTRSLSRYSRLTRRPPGSFAPGPLLALLLAVLAGLLTTLPLAAQPNPPVPVTEAAATKGRLDAIRTEIKQAETRLRDRDPTETGLVLMRQQVIPLIDELREQLGEAEPRVDQARKRLEQLGAKPDAKTQPESADIATERTEREKALAEADESQRLTRDALAQAEQLQTEIGDKRRALFARALFQRGPSLLSPDLWRSAMAGLDGDWRSLRLLIGDWGSSIHGQVSRGSGFTVLLSLLAAAALYILRSRHLPKLVEGAALRARSSRLSLLLLSLLHIVAGAMPAVLASWLLYAGLSAAGMIPYRLDAFVWAILGGIAFVVFSRTLADATLAPGHPERRIFGLADRNAVILRSLISAAATTIVLSKVAEALLQAISAGLSVSIIVRGLFAIMFAVIVAIYLRQLRTTSSEEEQCLGPYVPVDGAVLAPFRIVGWGAIALIVLAALGGFVALASFLVEQNVWLVLVAVMLALAVLLVDAGAHHTLQDTGRVSRALQSNIGLRQKSIAQVGLLGAGFAKLALYFTAGLLVLAPWGVESGDILSSLRAAFFGFKVGDVTVSLSSIIVAAILFSLGLLATKTMQGWLEEKFLPATDLDLGLRNSIKTAAGYIGFVAAIALAFSSLGFSLEKLTIVAGALSVGIGFGLQSIVSNFVSGLILLWERPIRVGDLIVVGDGEGVVRRINVRSTEIETFDRSTVIVPNSNLISGVVKNRVRSDRTGRVIISLSVPRTTDAGHIRDVLLDVAKSNPDVLREPPPRVFFRKIGEGSLDFDLICVVPEIDTAGRVSSDLHFEIFSRLAKEGIGQPEREVSIKGLDRIEDTLEDIADAIEDGQEMEAAGRAQAARAAAPKKSKGNAL